MMSLLNPRNRNTMLMHVEDEMNRLFDQFFGSNSLQTVKSKLKSGYPKLDVLETDKEYVIECAIPGVNPDDVKIEIIPQVDDAGRTHKYLRISGKVDYKYQYPESTEFTFKELRRSQFVREVTLKDYVDENLKAEYEYGMLRLSWSKPTAPQSVQPKLIPITKKA